MGQGVSGPSPPAEGSRRTSWWCWGSQAIGTQHTLSKTVSWPHAHPCPYCLISTLTELAWYSIELKSQGF